jgi:putative tricarboxylic transport membrane protein
VTFKLWRGLMGPPDLTRVQTAWWHQLAEAVSRTGAWRQYLTRNGQSDGFLPGEPFQVFLESEWDWYEKHLRLAGLIAP